MRFHILASGRLVGTSALEHFDDGMGVAFGRFEPSDAYATIRDEIIRAAEARNAGHAHSGPKLDVATESGERLATGFVTIDDFDVAVDPEVTVKLDDREQWENIANRRA
jgi:hypothetical protein